MLCHLVCVAGLAHAPLVHVGCPLVLLPARVRPSQPRGEPHSALRTPGTAACGGSIGKGAAM